MDRLRDWERFFVPGGLLVVSPERHRRIRIVDRARPVPLRVLVDDLLRPRLEGATAELTRPPRAIVTAEGELAAILEVLVRAGDHDVQRSVGVVYAEEHVALIDGRVDRSDLAGPFRALIEQLTKDHCLSLGTDRARRYFYEPPAGWHPFARPRVDLWFHPQYPRVPGVISVFYARPNRNSSPAHQRSFLYEQLTGEHVDVSAERTQIAAHDLAGDLVRREGVVNGRARVTIEVVLEGATFLYPMRLETDVAHEAADVATFRALVASARALPTASIDHAGFGHWIE